MARRNWMEDYLAGRPDEMHTEEPKASAAGTNPYPYGGSYWDNKYMTEDELKDIDGVRQAAQRGEISWSDANKYAEPIRAGYGYSGGKDGSQYIPLNTPVRTDSYENTISDVMARMANWDQIMGADPYQAGIDRTYQAILDRKPFEFDLESDPAWQAYRKQYTREGRRASEDTLGQYAAMTGGMPSTAAMTAASQAGDYYAAQMTDKIPELYRLAYSMYADNANRQLADLNAIRGLSGDWYGRQQDAYGRLGDLFSLASGERSYADTRSDKAAADAYQYAMATGDYSYLRELGYDTSFLEKQRDKEMAELDKPELSLAEVNAAIKAGNTAPNVLKAWEYYYGAPYSGATGGYGGGGGNYTLKGDDTANPYEDDTANPYEIDYGNPLGMEMINNSKGNPNLAYTYLANNWDNLNYQMKHQLMMNMGIDPSVAIQLRDRGLSYFQQYISDNADSLNKKNSAGSITYSDPKGQYMVDMTNNPNNDPDKAKKAEEYYMANWDKLDYYMRFRLLQNAGVDDETARWLASGGMV